MESDRTEYSGLPRLVPPHSAYLSLSGPSLGLSVAPLGTVLIVDASRMLAIVFELSPPECQPSIKDPPWGDKSR